MAKYKAYPAYQSANSQWIDSIPLGWTRASLKFVVSDRITDGPHETPSFIEEGIPFLSAEAIKLNKLDFSRKRACISLKLHEIYSIKCLPQRNDILMVKSGNTTGALAIVETDEIFNIWSPLALIRCNRNKAVPRYIFYTMLADFFQTSVQLSWSQGTQPNIGMGVIENLHLIYPNVTTQNNIVSFLDHETEKINKLIEKQQQLIELLQEKRQAVISHAVTKGLNPDAPMKDSGVEWLGEVPEHWDVKKLKYLSSFISTGGTPKIAESFTDDDGINWFTPGDFDGTLIIRDAKKRVSVKAIKNGDAKTYPQHSILIIGIGATLGKVAISKNIFSCNQQINIITPNAEVNTEYLALSLFTQTEQMKQSSNSSTIGIMNQEKTKQIIITLPHKKEQIEIVDFIFKKIAGFDLLSNLVNRQVELLQERRTALISAAVTGKIDVRDWTPPTASEAATIEQSQEVDA
jgi:type I restriction enzyme S subunit